MPKNLIFILVLTSILLTAYVTLAINAGLPKPTTRYELETAINQANHLYRQEKAQGRDFSDGACLSDALLPNWVVDIVHNPRSPSDDLLQNQCPSYFQGRAQHLVELDVDGNLIRAQ